MSEITNNPKLMFVKFIHSTREHDLAKPKKKGLALENQVREGDKDVMMKWNDGLHFRKFIKAAGVALDGDGNPTESDLYFWGEWEPASYVVEALQDGDKKHLPAFLHEPVLFVNEKNGGTNTDPLVLGKNFMYSCCQQHKDKKKPTKKVISTRMRALKKGSIIVFGSQIDRDASVPKFVVDTVFVVGDSQEYTSENARKKLTNFVKEENYLKIMGIEDWNKPQGGQHAGGCVSIACGDAGAGEKKCGTVSEEPFTSYRGVTYDECPDGPFCFVPCKTALSEKDGKRMGFERPVLTLTRGGVDIINAKQPNGFKTTELDSEDDAKELWEQIKQSILDQGFSLGVHFDYRKEVLPK